MWWRRRYRRPWWLVLLAVLGLKSLWRGGYRITWGDDDDDDRDRRRRFRQKLREAFDVWKEPKEGTATEDKPEDVV